MLTQSSPDTDKEENFYHSRIDSGNLFLSAIQQRFDEYSEKGFMDILERQFYTHAKKKTLVSFSRYQANKDIYQVFHLGSYDYSGLNGHKDIEKFAIEAIQAYGTTSSGARLMGGTSDLHVKCEEALASFLGVDEVITFSSGFTANLAAIATLCREGDVVLSDKLNHQSINDALKLSGATIVRYQHCSLTHLEENLKKYAHISRKFIVTDGVFSMDGDIAPLREMIALCEKYGAKIIVDDAHGTGHLGHSGRGVCNLLGVTDKVNVITGSLSKGLPGIGGFIATDKATAKIIRAASNPYIFSASLPPAVSASVLKAIEILDADPQIVAGLNRITRYFIDELRSYGFELLNTESSIIPIVVYDEKNAFAMARTLQEKGIYVNPVAYPAVSRSKARIRITLSAGLTQEDVEHCLSIIKQCGEELGII